ncbi:MAG: PAS domain-containing sensor histidine kinase [Candidatus Moranbacteria bacterium]|nr:PAS domain-containing sensor histidine kinase [Candidatus Moranbacteria bacterium]
MKEEKEQKPERFPVSMLYSFLKYIPLSVYYKDCNGAFIAVSRTKAAHYGVTVEEMLGKKDSDFLLPDEAQSALEDDLEVMKTGQPIIGKEEKLTHPDSVVWVSATKAPWIEKGEIKGVFGVSIDITERKKAEEERQRAEEELKKLNEMILHILSIAKHDMRSKVMALISTIKLLMKGRFESIDVAYKDLYKTALQLEQILNDYLAESSLLKMQIPSKKTFDVGIDVVDPIIDEFSKEIEEKNIVIDNRLGGIPENEVILPEAIKIVVSAIFRNLLGNAIKHGKKGTRIAVGVEFLEKFKKFNVFDTGPLIPPEIREKMFEEGFSTGDSTGIGLSKCRSIVRLHGGDLWYETAGDGYNNFVFTIPA